MLWHILNTAMGHHGANSRLANGIMPETRTLSACLQPQVLQVHGFHLVSLLLLLIFSAYYYPSCCWWGDAKCQVAWAPATWPMLSTRTSKETLVHWPNRQVWMGCHVKYVNSVLQFLCVFLLWHEHGPKGILLWIRTLRYSKCLEPKFRI